MPKVNNPGIIDIKIKPKERIITKKLYVNREDIKEIEISVSTEVGDNPSDKIAIGIIDSKNKERYVQDDANLWHGFKIKKDGNYRIFIENYGEQAVDIGGYLAVNPYITKEEDEKFEKSNQ